MSVHEWREKLESLNGIETGTVSRNKGQSRGEQVGWVRNGRSKVQFEEGEKDRRGYLSGARDPFAMSVNQSEIARKQLGLKGTHSSAFAKSPSL